MTMQHQKTRLIDIFKRKYYKNYVPQKPILTSRDAGWQNMVFEHHLQSPHELPKSIYLQHIVVTYLKDVRSEYRMDDRFENNNYQTGDSIIIPSGIDYWNAELTDTEYIVMAIEPQKLLRDCSELIKGDRIEVIPTFPKYDPFIYGTALALKQELETDYKGCRLYAETLLNSLNIHLLRNYSTSPVELKQYSGGLSPRKLQTSIDYIEAHLAENISLETMATEVSMSRFYFCRLFKQSTGITPYQYLIKCRIERAKILLRQRKLSIADIALEVGFSNQSHFAKHFKRLVGATPKKFSNQ
ncbi:AraC family transcriptional regulator [cf. Phormidesmis sp. LEGE 11477]|uniref:response regulator transcription factor n=1 Tax=cf. Phormidesmis sp. LEGE 11477 TaxID=1828680 RepID=UPI00187EDFC7|nr:AraC family transcriptional regulator [cf. Phormidesmis sp. LEGE 11477]MBE9064600.1 helix-turn-helix transcriptional regulator [cf. Phormidesmis sp. LEGE 11477]